MISFGLCSRRAARPRPCRPAGRRGARRRHRVEPLARHVDRRAVGQVAAGGEVEAHEGVAGLQQRQEHRLVGLAPECGWTLANSRRTASWRARSPASRRRRRTRSRRSSAARIALGVFVGQHRALRLEHGAADDVLRRDQLDLGAGGARRRIRCRGRRRRRPWPFRCRSGARRARGVGVIVLAASAADSGSSTWAQRHDGLRLAAIAMPMPEPQTVIPRSARPSATPRRASRHIRDNRRFRDRSCQGRAHVVALLAQPGGELVLEVVPGMVGGEGDAHEISTSASVSSSIISALWCGPGVKRSRSVPRGTRHDVGDARHHRQAGGARTSP
jgi:hypothetical protein